MFLNFPHLEIDSMEWIAVVGSRRYPKLGRVKKFVERMAETNPSCVIVTGGAQGVDYVAEGTARALGLKVLICTPNWDKYGKSAGYKRNQEIVEISDRVVAFWDGKSAGTKLTIDLAKQRHKSLVIKLA
jgi:hypothetical protein